MSSPPPVQYDRYYTYEQLAAHLQAVAAACPDLVRLHAPYTTPEGRVEWLVEVTDFATGPGEAKPGYLVHANLHAPEVSGTTAALCLLERLLSDHRADLAGLVFYLIPRINPDGAEYALTTGGSIRSRFEERPCPNGLLPRDLNGDGLILNMRWQDPYGPYVADDTDPRLLRQREPGDAGPFYQMTSEGLLQDYDGGAVRAAQRGYDFNRNWGHNWQPEPLQWGAGNYAFSQPEMKTVADWVFSHPNIFGMLGFHNGCNAVLRPSATTADEDLKPGDLRVLQELAAEGTELTGFPPLAVRMYKTAGSPPISLKGHFTDWGYFGLGLHVFEIELGNSFNAAGITTEQYFAADERTRDREFRRRVMRHFDAHPEGEAWHDWTPCPHPQLGTVEVGGLHTIPYCCPPARALAEIGPRCADFILGHARRRPQLVLDPVELLPLGGGVHRLRATVGNRGQLSTAITEQALTLANQPVLSVRLEVSEGVEVVSRGQARELAPLAPGTGHHDLEWFVRGPGGGRLDLVASHPRAGTARVPLTLA